MKNCILPIIIFFICFTVQAQYNKDVIVEPLLKADTTSIGQKINYPEFQNDEISIAKVTIPSGKSTGWHKHSFPVFAYVLKGTLTIELENGKTILFQENSTFSEVIDTPHNGKNKGQETVVLIAFFMGEKGKPLSEHLNTAVNAEK